MRNALRALNTCHKGQTIGQKPISGNSKTKDPVWMSGCGFINGMDYNDLHDSFDGLASRVFPA
ncbi:MAG: hypothetical protein WC485_05360 [Opitutaceae bacterium]